MSLFREKLKELPETVKLALKSDIKRLKLALDWSTKFKDIIGVGSGGSYVAASYFAAAVRSQNLKASHLTPFQFRFGSADYRKSSVWIFSARGKSPDTLASVYAAKCHRAGSIILVTCNPEAESMPEYEGVHVIVLPSVGKKDGFLATHSLVMTTAMLMRTVLDTKIAKDHYRDAAEKWTDDFHIGIMRERFKHMSRFESLIILADPRAQPLADLLETSIWETGLCNVQVTDPRNFAHGRHTLLSNRPAAETTVLMLQSMNSLKVFNSTMEIINEVWPGVGILDFNLGYCNPMHNAKSILEGLSIINAMGDAVGIDPAKPGTPEGARKLYYDDTFKDFCEGGLKYLEK